MPRSSASPISRARCDLYLPQSPKEAIFPLSEAGRARPRTVVLETSGPEGPWHYLFGSHTPSRVLREYQVLSPTKTAGRELLAIKNPVSFWFTSSNQHSANKTLSGQGVQFLFQTQMSRYGKLTFPLPRRKKEGFLIISLCSLRTVPSLIK